MNEVGDAGEGAAPWEEVLGFWFPDRAEEDLETHGRHWAWRMRGGADAEIVARFVGLTERAARGELDPWAADPRGRLALLVLLDQFPRSVWRDDPRAYAQDPRAVALAEEGLENGHFEALAHPWERLSYVIPFGHWEGPGHLERIDRAHDLARRIHEEAPAHLRPSYAYGVDQQVLMRRVIEAFGRHPHRNAILGRASTPEEEAYLAQGSFPHTRPIEHREG